MMVNSDFKNGDRVRYVPFHAHNDTTHIDCETGIVSSVRGEFVFVKYLNDRTPYKTCATKPSNLVHWKGA